MSMSCGAATMGLLAQYGIDTVFGIPGVHTLDFCSGLGEDSSIQHIQVRNEQGAGFMAEGYARATGKPAVALVISGPGVQRGASNWSIMGGLPARLAAFCRTSKLHPRNGLGGITRNHRTKSGDRATDCHECNGP